MSQPVLTLSKDGDLYVTTDHGDGSWSCKRLGKPEDLTPADIPDGAVFDATKQRDQDLIHAEAIAFNFGSKRVARQLRAVIDARLDRRPGRRYPLMDGPLPVHLEISRQLDKD